MSKTVKILSVLLIAIMLLSTVSTVFATDPKPLMPNDVTAQYANSKDTEALKSTAGRILGWIRNIAAIAAVIIIAVLGIKFMIGSTEERAEYKKSFLPLIIGIVVVLSATTLAGWLFSIV